MANNFLDIDNLMRDLRFALERRDLTKRAARADLNIVRASSEFETVLLREVLDRPAQADHREATEEVRRIEREIRALARRGG